MKQIPDHELRRAPLLALCHTTHHLLDFGKSDPECLVGEVVLLK